MTPHTARPAPRATTRVCKTPIALLKNAISLSSLKTVGGASAPPGLLVLSGKGRPPPRMASPPVGMPVRLSFSDSFITDGSCPARWEECPGNRESLRIRGALRSFVRLDHFKFVFGFQPQTVVEELLDVKAVLLVSVRRVLEIGVLGQVVLVRQKRPHAPQLEDALAAVQHRKLVHGRKLMAEFLEVLAVGFLAALADARVVAVYGLLAQGGGKLFQGGRLRAAEENTGVAVADDGVGVVLVDGLELALRLKHQTRRDFPAADGRHQLFQVGYLPDVGALVNQAAHMDREAPVVHIICFLAQQIEKLAVYHGDQEVKGAVRVAHDEEQRRFPVPQSVQLQLVIPGDLPQLLDVKGRKAGAAGDEDALGRLAVSFQVHLEAGGYFLHKNFRICNRHKQGELVPTRNFLNLFFTNPTSKTLVGLRPNPIFRTKSCWLCVLADTE